MKYTTKNPHGLTRDMLIEEQLNKQELLDKATHEWGLEDDGTIELYLMTKSCTYRDMVTYYNLRNEAMASDFGFDF